MRGNNAIYSSTIPLYRTVGPRRHARCSARAGTTQQQNIALDWSGPSGDPRHQSQGLAHTVIRVSRHFIPNPDFSSHPIRFDSPRSRGRRLPTPRLAPPAPMATACPPLSLPSTSLLRMTTRAGPARQPLPSVRCSAVGGELPPPLFTSSVAWHKIFMGDVSV